MPIPAVGDRAPHFKLQDSRGRQIKLSDLKGKNARVFGKVDTSTHSHDVLDALKKLV